MRNTMFETSVKARRVFSTMKILSIGFALGAIVTALYLDGRGAAVLKAFNNPQAVNATQISTEIINK